ncbi:MAG: hypothetical protein KJ623_03145 [Nanoarchaeota archaeon]|nr:hypothetical protein [Nanoarchaeota archaeon]MBU0963328.1 hypothetical protein [Nanoarchaeota archaeon]
MQIGRVITATELEKKRKEFFEGKNTKMDIPHKEYRGLYNKIKTFARSLYNML